MPESLITGETFGDEADDDPILDAPEFNARDCPIVTASIDFFLELVCDST
ncbi:uncharacterized protein PHALS_08981 [Plasmopara halstedii]|uniref:Uncharacterized protein n=1 Tax=Plasmopara halstedii TaxID=4781 RepID=A0A0P1AEW4_PLAHL|nr:uncharacterized protein PHALS_08981 [Plasmopara halstedii]CEG38936.1 hypothetical protein PHALS_08981 [Plasmopara halstedii]|eukprot:XP_024575305.1 hypothetical protein PHALS_08981 [Plasmopara halstedii]